MLSGSLQYMAPELFENYADNYLPKTTTKGDVWSAGVVLYELCIGTKPFDHKDDEMMIVEMIKKYDD